MAVLTQILSMCALGAIVLYVSFTLVAGISPTEVAAPTSVVITLSVLLYVRSLRRRFDMGTRGDSPLRRWYNFQRERRGF